MIRNMAFYCKDFFASSGRWAQRMGEKGHHYGDKYFTTRQGYLENYIIPAFGDLDPRGIRRRDIDNWLLGLRGRGGKKLAGATKNKIMYTMSLIFEELMDLELIEKNPIRGLKPFNKNPVLPRGVIDRESMVKLYPETREQLLAVWGSPLWASMMLVFYDTGCRPGELRALIWGDLDREKRFFPIRKGVAAGTADTIKSTKTGAVRVGFLSVRTVGELEFWRQKSPHNRNEDFIFTRDGKKPISAGAVIKAFRRGLGNAGMAKQPWTPYWLRHSFGTYHMEHLNQAELMRLMGHNTAMVTRIYQHPDNETLYQSAEAIKVKLDRARE